MKRLVAIALAVACTVGAVVAVAVVRGDNSHATHNATGRTDTPGCRNMDPPCPPPRSQTDITQPENYDSLRISLLPPRDATPNLSAAEAIDKAWGPRGMRLGADTELPILAMFHRMGYPDADQLVWAVRLSNACVPRYGPPEAADRPTCKTGDWNVLIDAGTGDVLFEFQYAADA